MKREKLKKIVQKYYSSEHTIKSIMCGRMKPNPDIRYEIEKKHKVPFHVWGGGLKEYLQHNNTANRADNSTTTKHKKVQA